MKRFFLLALVILSFIIQNITADGGFIPRDPSIYYNMVEDQQIAVIDIQDEHNVNVDMFISIIDKSNKSHEIVFFLPFYEKPKSFNVEEKDYNEFEKQKTKPLDRFITDNSKWKDDAKERILLSAAGGWFISGGPSFLGIMFWQMGTFGVSAMGISPEQVITTEHARVEVYNVTSEKDLEELLSKADVSKEVKDKIRDFRGTYLYFITLKTIPAKKTEKYRSALNSLGVHFSFQVEPKDGVYTYPLSTGKTWYNPIPLTRVYIRNSRDVSINLEYPKIGIKVDQWRYYDFEFDNLYLAREYPQQYQKWGIHTADDPNFIVNRITYLYSNPDQDVKIKITARSSSAAFFEKSWAAISRLLSSIIIPLSLLVLPLLFWFLFFKIFISKLVQYPSKLKMYLNALLYFVISSIIQTSLSWMAILFFFIVMFAISRFEIYWMNWYNTIFFIILIPALLIPVILGTIVVSFIFKLHNKLKKLPLVRFLATYILTMVSYFAIAALAYFII